MEETEMKEIKKIRYAVIILAAVLFLTSCGNPNRYNTQRGAAIGAGFGALAGQMIGRNTKGTLIGAGVGTLLGAIVGNAVDQERQAAEEAAAPAEAAVGEVAEEAAVPEAEAIVSETAEEAAAPEEAAVGEAAEEAAPPEAE